MTDRQAKAIYDVFDGAQATIFSVWDFRFLTDEWRYCEYLRADLLIYDPQDWCKWWGERIAKAIYTNDPDTSAYLQEMGGVFIHAGCRLPDPKTVKFDANGKWRSYCPQIGQHIVGVWAKNYDTAICKLAAEILRLQKVEIEKARKMQEAQK